MRTKNVVVLESNVTLQQELKEAMESSEELRVVYAGDDGEAGIKQIQQQKPEMAIVGMFLKGTDGCGVIRAIRKQGGTPKIIATGVSNDALMEKAMNEGADYYLVKPFSFEELMARVRALTRRSAPTLAPFYTLCDLTLDPNSHTVTRAGREIKLSAKEFALLEYLLRNQGRVLSRENIENNLWNFDYEGGSNAVDVYIRYLRRKIDEAFSPKLIHTVRGVGYVLKEETPQKGE